MVDGAYILAVTNRDGTYGADGSPAGLRWRIVRDGSPAEWVDASDVTETAADVATHLAALGYAGEDVLLALPSHWCLSASVQTADLPENDAKARLYRLEERLPLSAEAITADFIAPAPSFATSLAVCVPTAPMAELLAAFDQAGVRVRWMTPLALLAVQGSADADAHSAQSMAYLVDGGADDRLDVVLLRQGRPVGWTVVHASDPARRAGLAATQIRLLEASVETPEQELAEVAAVIACGLAREERQAIAAALARDVVPCGVDPLAAALAVASAVAADRQQLWVQLRRDALAAADGLARVRHSLNHALAALVLLGVIGVAVLGVRSDALREASAAADAALLHDMRAAYPGWFDSADVREVRTVLAQERRSGRTDGSPPGSGAPAQSALQTLGDVLGRLPADVPVRLDRSTFEGRSFELAGSVRGFEDVDKLAAAVRGAGVDVPPPQARRSGDGSWTFTLRGTWPAAFEDGKPRDGTSLSRGSP